jgi:hypothetical protein
MSSQFSIVILLGAFIWLGLLSFLFWNLYSHYTKLVKGANNKSLKAILDVLLKNVEESKKDISHLESRCDTIEKDGLLHIQKIGLLRFNPFKDTGGDQSFILALLDGKDTGVVISGLYSRSGTRWYAKKVIEGEGTDHDLSDEEKKAIKQAHP